MTIKRRPSGRIQYIFKLAFLFSAIFATAGFVRAASSITQQPLSQNAILGSNVTFTVEAVGALPPFPNITSGDLQVWLAADTGVVTNETGLVSEWFDQSGNTNSATQSDSSQQPELVYPPGIGGYPALRFSGGFLSGSGNIPFNKAMTAFVLYNEFDWGRNTLVGLVEYDYVSSVWYAGRSQGGMGTSRGYGTFNGQIAFVTDWDAFYTVPYIIPTNTYRIAAVTLPTNASTAELIDESVAGETNFTTGPVDPPFPESSAPLQGYYVGGYPDAFDGDIAELIFYSGDLTPGDQSAVIDYLAEKYLSGTNGLSFQWQFDGTNIAGATNSVLTLTDLQTNQAGSYSVIVSNVFGSVASSNAMLNLGYSPSPNVLVTPQSIEVAEGMNATFTASPTGTPPFSFQWTFSGQPLAQATNSVLSLTNVQSTNAGGYQVIVSNAYGTGASSNIVLTVVLPPVISLQPQSQTALVGSNVTFSVFAGGLPTVTTGTLQLWLKADTGVVTNVDGLVTDWQDQSGNTNNAVQTNVIYQPSVVNPAGVSDMPAVRFDGVGTNVNFLQGSGTVNTPNAMTSFTVLNMITTTNYVNLAWLIGVPGGFEDDRAETVYQGVRVFNLWGYGYETPFVVPTNTYRIWTDRIPVNQYGIELFDWSANSSTNFVLTGQYDLSNNPSGYYVGGLDPSFQGAAVAGYQLYGDIAEWLVYSGYLSDEDRLAVQAYLEQKYFQISGADNYQWQFDGTNITGATNATLTLSNIQPSAAGSYSVIVGNSLAFTTNSNAVLTVVAAPHYDNPVLELVSLSENGQTNSVAVDLVSDGNVNSAGFSIAFNSAQVRFVSASLGSGATGSAFIQNTNQAAVGEVGFVLGALSPAAFPAGTQPLVNLTFASISYSNTTVLSFSDTPVTSQLADVEANILTSEFVSANLSVGGAVWPTLSLSNQSTNAVLSWPTSATGFSLQASSALDGEWTNVTVTPVTNGSTLLVTAPLSTNTVYYRLKY